MAKKRMTDVDKWKKSFFRKLPLEYKLFWLYILDDCDHCGIWHVDLEIAEIKLGTKLSLQKARGFFEERVVEFDNGAKWFLPDFISFQYGSLDDRNKMSKPIIPILTKYSLMGHLSPINGVKVKDTVKEEVKVREGGSGETYPIEHCVVVALNDGRWVKANKTNQQELETFNSILERAGIYDKNPMDYKRHFSALKAKYPDKVQTKQILSIEEARKLAAEIDKK